MSDPTDSARMIEAFSAELPPFSGSEAIRNAARGRDPLQDAAVNYLERRWLGESGPGSGHTAIALLIVSASDAHVRRFADRVLFRVPDATGYRALAPLLRNLVDDAGLAALIEQALGSPDDRVAARALDLQYHCYGFPDRFTLSADDAGRIGARVAALRARDVTGGPLADALERYSPPPPSR